MGKLVEAEALKSGHSISTILSSVDANTDLERLALVLTGHDAVIDFSTAAAVAKNVGACVRADVPLVEGTTGWKDREADILRLAKTGALVYGANFSIGMNIFYRVVNHAAGLFSAVRQYAPFIEEAHHARKQDAPSGTAVHLRELMSKNFTADIPTASTRAGYIPGTHRVGFDSEADQVLLTHEARSRQGFAAGALLAAQWIIGRKGVFKFEDVIDEVLGSQ